MRLLRRLFLFCYTFVFLNASLFDILTSAPSKVPPKIRDNCEAENLNICTTERYL